MKINCPKCHKEIKPADVNVEKDTAYCDSCRELFTLSEMLNKTEGTQQDSQLLSQPPPSGLKVIQGSAETIIVSKRPRIILLFLIPFTCIWSGISLSGIYGQQIIKGEFDLSASLFGLPFLIGTLVLLTVIVFTIFGKIMMKLDGNGVTLDSHCFRIPTPVSQYSSTRDYPFERPVQSPKRSLFSPKFLAWKDLKTIMLASPRRQRSFPGMDVDTSSTLIIPPIPAKQREYMLALLRDAAHRKGSYPKTVQDW